MTGPESAWPDLPSATTGFSVFRELPDGRGRQYTSVHFVHGHKGAVWLFRQLRIFGVRQGVEDIPAYALLDAIDADGEVLQTYDLPTRQAFAYAYRKLGLRVTYTGGRAGNGAGQ